jgi:hypothetical protein
MATTSIDGTRASASRWLAAEKPVPATPTRIRSAVGTPEMKSGPSLPLPVRELGLLS